MVLFLTGLVAMILLRTLKRDYAKYTRADEDDIEALERDSAEESGWKLVHGDVFRPPRHPELLSALVGTGELFGCCGCTSVEGRLKVYMVGFSAR